MPIFGLCPGSQMLVLVTDVNTVVVVLIGPLDSVTGMKQHFLGSTSTIPNNSP